MKRILTVLTVALVMVAIVVVTAMPGVAKSENACCDQTNAGGQKPGGVAVGIPATNSGGNDPPGQQPKPPGQDKKKKNQSPNPND